MKKILYLTICCVGLFVLMSCGGITVKGENGQKYESYQECCAAQDFQAAHQYLARMKNAIGDDEEKLNEFKEAHEYVFKQEALYLMSIGDETAKKRILYLLKEEDNNNNHVAMLIDLAIENDDEDFVKALANQYQGSGNSQGVMKLCEYLLSKKSPDNVQFIGSLLKKTRNERLYLDIAIKNNDQEFINQYATNHMSFYESTLLNYLASLNLKEQSEKIIALLTENENEITKKPKLGVKRLFSGDVSKVKKQCDEYIYSVESHNNKCRDVLSIAIKNKNLYLAQRAASKAKGNIYYEHHGNGDIIVLADNNDVNSIKSTLNDAIRSGAFK